MKKIIILIIITITYCRGGVPGDLDSTFGINGIVKIPPISGHDMTIQNDGKIYIPSTIWTGKAQGFLVMRFNPDGSFDSTFGDNGKVIKDLGQRDAYAKSVLLLEDGKIIVVGDMRNKGDGWSIALVKYHQNGIIDSTFGNNGVALSNFPIYLNIYDAILYNESSYLVGGMNTHETHNYSVTKFIYNGNLDATFGIMGESFIDINDEDWCMKLAIQKDGKILLCGYTYENIQDRNAVIVRFNPDGIIDSTFGTSGIVKLFYNMATIGQGIEVQPDGNILISGGFLSGVSNTNLFLTRLYSNGKVDKTFGTAGTVFISYGYDNSTIIRKIFLNIDGSIIFPWHMEGARFAVVRFDRDGKLDPNFGYARTKKYLPIGYLIAGSFTPEGNLLLLGKGTVPGEPFSFFLKVLLTDEVGVDNIYNSNDEISLYPNPVGNEALVQYDVTTYSHVTIEVYNYMGQQVTVLLDSEYHSIGRHIRRLDFSTLHNPGVYFLKQKIGNDIKILKFMK